ncbi:MAG TPA: bifunctional adenosylcobinamide kinase/adenosylcobinamide-phosphate guanylyltransferase [Chloroflexota bacterium]|nr:bifunctional adenosylcobinamide kinase/adenosylcobinamide-phosphate guanylyltransferase [Chloroflexota bacterium]
MSGPTTTLILGGARGGKSDWAVDLAQRSGRPVVYVATATPDDAEMAERIANHRATRPHSWHTVEAPLDLSAAVTQHSQPGDLVLIDCLTLWVSNVVLRRTAGEAEPDALPPRLWRDVEAELLTAAAGVLDSARERDVSLILVSNEVGMGVVPPYVLGRGYRDVLGSVNRAVAARADPVALMVAGLPIDLRRLLVAAHGVLPPPAAERTP